MEEINQYFTLKGLGRIRLHYDPNKGMVSISNTSDKMGGKPEWFAFLERIEQATKVAYPSKITDDILEYQTKDPLNEEDPQAIINYFSQMIQHAGGILSTKPLATRNQNKLKVTSGKEQGHQTLPFAYRGQTKYPIRGFIEIIWNKTDNVMIGLYIKQSADIDQDANKQAVHAYLKELGFVDYIRNIFDDVITELGYPGAFHHHRVEMEIEKNIDIGSFPNLDKQKFEACGQAIQKYIDKHRDFVFSGEEIDQKSEAASFFKEVECGKLGKVWVRYQSNGKSNKDYFSLTFEEEKLKEQPKFFGLLKEHLQDAGYECIYYPSPGAIIHYVESDCNREELTSLGNGLVTALQKAYRAFEKQESKAGAEKGSRKPGSLAQAIAKDKEEKAQIERIADEFLSSADESVDKQAFKKKLKEPLAKLTAAVVDRRYDTDVREGTKQFDTLYNLAKQYHAKASHEDIGRFIQALYDASKQLRTQNHSPSR